MPDKPRSLIVLEFNELCPPILEKLMAEGALPNFSRLHERAEVFVSTTEDEHLEPWIQWVSYHTGQPQKVHGITELDQGHQISLRQIWDRLAEAGKRILVFGSMNAGPATHRNLTVVPDPWSRHVPPSDDTYRIFHEFIAHKVAEHANPDARSGVAQAIAFARFLIGHGLSLRTVKTALAQLFMEKAGRRDRRWQRATVLDLLSWDVFKHRWRKNRPDAAFFFANSVAFYQHRYWRHMAVDDYDVKPSAGEMASYGDAIKTGYQALDLLVGDALKMAGSDGAVILVTALSQEANLKYEEIGGKFVHRPRDFKRLFDWLDAPASATAEPVMTHQAWATFETEAEARTFQDSLDRVMANDAAVFAHRRERARVMFWCDFIREVAADLTITRGDGETAAFADLFAPVGMVNTSQHHREGAFWVMAPGRPHRITQTRLPLEQATEMTMAVLSESPALREVA